MAVGMATVSIDRRPNSAIFEEEALAFPNGLAWARGRAGQLLWMLFTGRRVKHPLEYEQAQTLHPNSRLSRRMSRHTVRRR